MDKKYQKKLSHLHALFFGYLVLVIVIAGLIVTDKVEVKFRDAGPASIDYEDLAEKRAMRQALSEALPAYLDTLQESKDLTDEQKESLKLAYVPVVREYLQTGDVKKLDKAQTLKSLIVSNKIQVTKETGIEDNVKAEDQQSE